MVNPNNKGSPSHPHVYGYKPFPAMVGLPFDQATVQVGQETKLHWNDGEASGIWQPKKRIFFLQILAR